MHIKKMYATFGCLENKSLSLSRGLNIITAPNESGKSTWSAFIRTMFFGISTREKARAGHLPDKERYRPWSGSAMYGRMELCKNGEDIEIERTARFDVFSKAEVRNVTTGEVLEAGEELVGISRSAYERTAFIGQARINIDGDRDTERLILSVASGTEEGVSAAEITSRLERQRRELRSPRGLGSLSELERRIEQLESSHISESLAALRDECHSLALCASRADTALSEARLTSAKAEAEVSAFSAFEGMSDSLAKTAALRDISTLRDAEKKKISLPGIASIVSAGVIAALAALFRLWLLIPATALVVLGISLLITKGQSTRKKIRAEMQLRYGSAKVEDIEASLDAYTAAFLRLENAETNVQNLEKKARSAKIAADMKQNEFLAAEAREKEKASVRLAEAREKRERLLLEFEAYELAGKIINEADAELRSNFSPALERRAAEIFFGLTGGSFDTVKIKNSDFEMDVAKGQASAPRSALSLSQGTADELYLSLRLALCETVLDKDEAPPIVLDDALVNFDDVRMQKALELLKQISRSRQVILFSCHAREAAYFANDAEVNKITI